MQCNIIILKKIFFGLAEGEGECRRLQLHKIHSNTIHIHKIRHFEVMTAF